MPLIDFILHIDVHLRQIIADYGTWTYLVLFGIIFCETGLVVLPLLPGDSLLFAAGAFAAAGSLDVRIALPLLVVAAVVGDNVNYTVGRVLGPKVLCKENSRVFRRSYLDRTQAFFDKYGRRTLVAARFAPIVRTFAPFMAGVGQMKYPHFLGFSIIGGVAWVSMFVLLGYFFGRIPAVAHNFSLAVIAIVLLSVMPTVWHTLRGRFGRASEAQDESA